MTRRRFAADEPEFQPRTGRNAPDSFEGLPLFAPVRFQTGSVTSEAAARAIEGASVARLRAAVLQAFVDAGPGGLTADEAAAMIGESVLAVRPRVTEWYQSGHLIATTERRTNASGLSARVLRRAI